MLARLLSRRLARRPLGSMLLAAAAFAVAAGCRQGEVRRPVAPGRDGGPTDGGLPERRAAVLAVDPRGNIRWTMPLRSASYLDSQAPPLVDASSGYTTAGNELRAFDLASGHERWRFDVGGAVYGAWLAGDTLVALIDQVSTKARVLGVRVSDGALVWQWRAPGHGLFGNQVLAGGRTLVVATAGGEIVALDAARGAVRWAAQGGPSPLLAAAGDLVLSGSGGALRAYRADDGGLAWQTAFDAMSRPIVLGDAAVNQTFADPARRPLVGYALADGKARWQIAANAEFGAPVATAAGLLVRPRFALQEWALIDPSDGTFRWRSRALGLSFGAPAPVLAGAELVAVETEPSTPTYSLVSRRVDDGMITHVVPLGSQPIHSIVPRPDGSLLVGTSLVGGASEGRLIAIDRGKVAWSIVLPAQPLCRPTLLPDGGAIVQVASPPLLTTL